jgi:hypothetical protein
VYSYARQGDDHAVIEPAASEEAISTLRGIDAELRDHGLQITG